MDPVDLPLSLSNCTLIDVMDTAEQLAIMDRNEKSSTEKEKSSSKFKSTSSSFLTSLKSSLLSKSKKSSSDEYTEPTVVITEQPTKNDSRFRYSSEGKTAGIIKGANNNFPSIKVHGFKGKAKVLVSCVSAVGASGSKDEGADDYFVHPHLLVGNYTDPYHKYQDPGVKKLKDSGVIKALLDKNMTFKLKNVGIQCIKKCDRESILRIRKELKIDPFNQGFGHVETCKTTTDISTVRICFQVFIYDKHNKETPLDPVVTEPIVDKKAAPDLEISLISELFPPTKGEKEIMIFTSKIDKNDIEVVLQKVEGQTEGAPIRIKPNRVHYGFGLSFKTPESIMANTETPVKFNLYLQRPKSGGRSKHVELTYLPDGCKPVLPKNSITYDGSKETFPNKLKRSVETMMTNFSRKKRITTYNEKKGFEDEASDVEKKHINTFAKKDEEGHGKPRATKTPHAQDLQAKIHHQHLMTIPDQMIENTAINQFENITHLENQYESPQPSNQSNVYPIKDQNSSNHVVTIEYQPTRSPRSDQQLPPFDVFGPNFNNGSSDGSQYCFTSPSMEPTLDESPDALDEDCLSRILHTLTSMEEKESQAFNATNSPAITTENVSPEHQGSVSQVTKKYVILEKVADENNLDYEPQIKPLNFDQQKTTATTNQQNHTIPITYHLVEAPLQIHANSQMYLTENNFCFGSNEQQLVSSNQNFEFYQAPVSRLSLPPLTPISTGAAQHQTNHNNQSQEVGCSPLGQRSNDSELMATGTVTYPCYVEYDSNQMFYDTAANAFGQMCPDDYQRDIPRDILSPQGQCDSSVSSESEDSMQSTNIPPTTWTKYLDGPGLQTKDQGNSRPCKNSRVNRSVSSESENSIRIINIEPRKRQNESSLRNKLRVKHPSGKAGKQTGGIRLRISRRGKSSANFSVKLQLGKKDAAIDEKLSGDLQKMSMDENN